MSEYGRQLQEKQRVKQMYGLRERQFKRCFKQGVRMQGPSGENLLSLLERRLDNVLYRLKMCVSREQARQMVVHGHVLVNNRSVKSPSYCVAIGNVVALAPRSLEKNTFVEQVVDKRMKLAIKVPEWLELEEKTKTGRVLRIPVRSDIQIPIEEHLIVELYSK